MQCLLVGIEIIHEKTPACSSTHTASREAYNATVGRDRLMTHYSCLDVLGIQKKKKFPTGKSNKLKAGREKNKGNEWQDYALVFASYTHNIALDSGKKKWFTETRTNKFASLPSGQPLKWGESHLLTPAANLSWKFEVTGQSKTSVFFWGISRGYSEGSNSPGKFQIEHGNGFMFCPYEKFSASVYFFFRANLHIGIRRTCQPRH